MKHIHHLSNTIFFLILSSSLFAQAQPDWYPFIQPWNDSLTTGDAMRFFPSFNRERAGVHGFLKTSGDGQFVFEDGTPIKFVGVNFSFGASMSDSSIAQQVARRLAKLGVNVVRMHHMDNYNPWDPRETLLSLPTNGSDTRHINPEQIQRLGYFISELAKNGIYSNINLHVSRQFQNADGVVNADSILLYGKAVSIFEPPIRMLMKEYARNLLGSINSATGLRFADDPRIAFVEITNENSLYVGWQWNALNFISGSSSTISYYHSRMLDSIWIAWLRQRYTNTDEVRNAWLNQSGMPIVNMLKNGSFESTPGAEWNLEVNSTSGADAAFKQVAEGVDGQYSEQIDIRKVTGTSWHIQFKQVGTAKIIRDTQYTISFYARASHPRVISIGVMNNIANYENYGISRSIDLATDWQLYHASFRATATDSINTRLTFTLGYDTGSVSFDDVRFTSLNQPGLLPDESLEAGTIRRLNPDDAAALSQKRLAETAEFLLSLQKNFFDDMHSYIRDSIGVKCPIGGTNWFGGLGDLYTQSGMDYIDNHAYWQHPQFPNQPWDSFDWFIENTPMTSDTSLGNMPRLSAYAIAKKPYVVSEYNHPAPNRYQCEMPLHLAAYASLQDWNGMYIYSYHHGHSNWSHQKINGFFDVDGNPIVISLLPQMSQVFRNGFIRPAQTEIQLDFARSDMLAELAKPRSDLFFSGLSDALPLINKVRVKSFTAVKTPDASSYNIPQLSTPYKSDTDQLKWNPSSNILTMNAKRIFAYTGFIPRSGIDISQLGLYSIYGDDKFCSLIWTSVDGNDLVNSKRSLITFIGRAENTGMIWDGNQTVHDHWGTTPTMLEPQSVQLNINRASDVIKVFPLDSLGRVMKDSMLFYPRDEMGTNRIILDQKKYKTPWFGVERDFIPVAVHAEQNEDKKFSLDIFPNPVHSLTQVRFHIPSQSFVTIEMRDMLGRSVKRISDREMNIGGNVIQINTNDLPSGNYLVTLNASSVRLTKLITVMRN